MRCNLEKSNFKNPILDDLRIRSNISLPKFQPLPMKTVEQDRFGANISGFFTFAVKFSHRYSTLGPSTIGFHIPTRLNELYSQIREKATEKLKKRKDMEDQQGKCDQ